MSRDDDRLLDICKNVSEEKDSGTLTALIVELNQELQRQRAKKQPEPIQPEPDVKQKLAG